MIPAAAILMGSSSLLGWGRGRFELHQKHRLAVLVAASWSSLKLYHYNPSFLQSA